MALVQFSDLSFPTHVFLNSVTVIKGCHIKAVTERIVAQWLALLHCLALGVIPHQWHYVLGVCMLFLYAGVTLVRLPTSMGAKNK